MSEPAIAGSGAHSRTSAFARMPRLTLRGILFLIVAVALIVLSRIFLLRELAFAGSLLFVLPLLGYVLVLVRRLRLRVVRRTDPEIMEAGRSARVTLTFSNLGTLPSVAARWIDPMDGLVRQGASGILPTIRGFRSTLEQAPPTATVVYELSSPVRGSHTFGPVEVTVSDPFGMATQTIVAGAEEEVTITPRIWAIGRSAIEVVASTGEERHAGRIGRAGEIDVLTRKYQTGDSMRRVNWPATARFGELMVRQEDQNGTRDAIIVLDSDPASYPGSSALLQGQDDLEWAVSAACSIGAAALGDGYSVGLATVFDDARRSLRIYAQGDHSRLILDGAAIRRTRVAEGADLSGLLGAAYGTQGAGATVFAVLGARSPASLVIGLPSQGGGAVALIVVPDEADHPAQPALDLERELTAAGWNVRLVVASE